MRKARAAIHLVLHSALRLRCQSNLLQVEGSEGQVELEWILKVDDSAALGSLSLRDARRHGIDLHVLTNVDRQVAARWGRTRARRPWQRANLTRQARSTIRRIRRECDLAGAEIGGLQYVGNHRIDGLSHRGGVSAGSAGVAGGGDGSLLRGLLDGGIDIEGAS